MSRLDAQTDSVNRDLNDVGEPPVKKNSSLQKHLDPRTKQNIGYFGRFTRYRILIQLIN